MSNTITIELCAEDRARLDRLTTALGIRVSQAETALTITAEENRTDEPDALQQQLAAAMAKASTPTEAPQESQEAPKAESKENTQPTEEPTTAPEPVTEAAPETEEPVITLEQIHQKVLQLASSDNGSKKAAVREIINTYASRVTDLPEDKWTEVWGKLTALEGRG